MKVLSGSDLAGFIKERQSKAVRSLRQAHKIVPTLAIVRTNSDPVVDSYMRLKSKYGADIFVDVQVHDVLQKQAIETISKLNDDPAIHGIIVQIPLPDPTQTDTILNAVAPQKDVDGLGNKAILDPATPMAISWLLSGYNITMTGKNIVIVGNGRLVGKPLAKMWKNSGLNVSVADSKVANLSEIVQKADILICATGVPGLITSEMVNPEGVMVDAGVATDKNGLVGDISASVRQLPNISITPEKGGVGPLTVCALFENVIRAAQQQVQK